MQLIVILIDLMKPIRKYCDVIYVSLSSFALIQLLSLLCRCKSPAGHIRNLELHDSARSKDCFCSLQLFGAGAHQIQRSAKGVLNPFPVLSFHIIGFMAATGLTSI
jgi:hypothetical protein